MGMLHRRLRSPMGRRRAETFLPPSETRIAVAVRAKITMRDGRIRYVTVMFPNSPYWAEQYRHRPEIKRIEQERE